MASPNQRVLENTVNTACNYLASLWKPTASSALGQGLRFNVDCAVLWDSRQISYCLFFLKNTTQYKHINHAWVSPDPCLRMQFDTHSIEVLPYWVTAGLGETGNNIQMDTWLILITVWTWVPLAILNQNARDIFSGHLIHWRFSVQFEKLDLPRPCIEVKANQTSWRVKLPVTHYRRSVISCQSR